MRCTWVAYRSIRACCYTHNSLFKMLRRSGFQKKHRYRVQSSRHRYNRRNTFRLLLNICLENLPKSKWDQVVMFMFLCALFPFFHALLGIGGNARVYRPAKATGESPQKSQGHDAGKTALFRNQLLQVASDTHAGYPVMNSEHIAHLTRAPIALAPQNAFPDPTSPATNSDIAPTLLSTPTFAQTPEPGAPVWFRRDKWDGKPYDPFYLEFNGIPWSTSTKAI
jgi:hypothetical protein